MKTRKLIALVIAVTTVAIAQAMPAKKRQIVTQPDGSQLSIIVYGDEWSHMATTTDGYTVISGNDGYVYYANQAPDGRLVASSIRAHNTTNRSAAERQALSGRRTHLVDQNAIQIGDMRRTQAQMVRAEQVERNIERAKAQGEDPNRVSTGSSKALVLLVQYQDVTFTGDAKTKFTNLLNQNGYSYNGAVGSVKNYYEAQSNSQLTVDFDVYGPYTLPNNMAYYGANDVSGNDVRPGQMIKDGLNLAKTDVPWSDYAVNNNIEHLIVIYAGYGEADNTTTMPNTIWPHEWSLSSATGSSWTYNGVTINTYCCSSELQSGGALTGIGVICHEFGHVLGLPDFYDTNYSTNGQSFGLNVISLMDSGGYCYSGNIPPAFNIVERWMSGWVTPVEITESNNYTLKPVYDNQSSGYFFKTKTANELFFLENRNGDLSVWDKVLKSGDTSTKTTGSGKGMLIYHYDRSNNIIGGGMTAATAWVYNRINWYADHECMKLMMATATTASSWGGVNNIGRIFYPGDGNVRGFVANGWNGYSGVSLSNITASGNNITFAVTASGVDPTIKNAVATPNNFDITLTWQGAPTGTWKVEYRAQGASSYASITVTAKVANIPNLLPGSKYEIVITDITALTSASLTSTTKVLNATALPSLNNIKGNYATSDNIILSVINLSKPPKTIEWFVDGTASQITAIQLVKGVHFIEAKVTNTDGSTEWFKKIIRVN